MAADADSKSPQSDLRREVRELKRLVSKQQERINDLAQQPAVLPETLEALGLDTPKGRRQAMKYAGATAALPTLVAMSMAEPARADEVAADVGTQADPWRTGFFAALNAGDGQQFTDWETGFNTHAVTKSSAYSTDGEHFIDGDTSVSGFTITLSTADAVLGHYIVLRQNGANNLTIDTEGAQNIDGSSSKTLQHDGAMIILWSDGSDWFSNEFIDRVNARELVTEKASINQFAAVLEKTTDQSINANTDTTVEWDNQDVDSDIFTYDGTNDNVDVLVAGDYRVEAQISVLGPSDQDIVRFRVILNGTLIRDVTTVASGTTAALPNGSVLLKDLAANDTIRIDARSASAGTIDGSDTATWAMLSREA